MTDPTPGAAGTAEAEKRFGQPLQPGHTPNDLKEGDAGFDGIAEAARRFADQYPTQKDQNNR